VNATTDTELTPELMARGELLSPENRYRLAMHLLSTLEPTTEVLEAERRALKAELTRRWERIQSGEEKTYTIEETMAALRAQNQARQS
jgi:putative addiction module component (TIGR02574 family)